MANSKEAARRRRELQAKGGTRIASIAIPDKNTWTKISGRSGDTSLSRRLQ